MQAIKKIAAAACIISICLMGSQAMAGNGYGKGKAGTGMAVDICAAEEIIVEGTVSEAELYNGQGIKIDDGNVVETVYGIGPLSYWDSLEGVTRPSVGDNVKIVARLVIFSDGLTKNIAISITFTDTGETVELRDENCLPNWRGGNGANKIARGGKGRGHGSGDGTGNGPKDGSGNGSRTGDCSLT